MTDGAVRVLLVRPEGPDRDGAALVARGVAAESDAYIAVRPCTDADVAGRIDDVLASISATADWLVVTSRAAIDALVEVASAQRVTDAIAAGRRRAMRFAAVGPTAAGSLTAYGAIDVVVPTQQDADGLAATLLQMPAATVVVPVGNLARPALPDALRAGGWTVHTHVVYETATVSSRPKTADRLSRGDFDIVVLRSPSAVAAVAHFVPVLPKELVAVCGGPTTAAAAHDSGFATIVVSAAPSAEAVADAVTRAIAEVDARGSDGRAE